MKSLNPETVAHNIATAYVKERIRNTAFPSGDAASKNSFIINVHKVTDLYMLAYQESFKHVDSANRAEQSFELEN